MILTNLPGHTGVDLDFVGALLDSWDSDKGSSAPDYFQLYIDGALLAQYTANNASGTTVDVDGGSILFSGVQFDTNVFFTDTVVDLAPDATLTFAHTAPTLSVRWVAAGSGWQGGERRGLRDRQPQDHAVRRARTGDDAVGRVRHARCAAPTSIARRR